MQLSFSASLSLCRLVDPRIKKEKSNITTLALLLNEFSLINLLIYEAWELSEGCFYAVSYIISFHLPRALCQRKNMIPR
jgi:hypothetical protein